MFWWRKKKTQLLLADDRPSEARQTWLPPAPSGEAVPASRPAPERKSAPTSWEESDCTSAEAYSTVHDVNWDTRDDFGQRSEFNPHSPSNRPTKPMPPRNTVSPTMPSVKVA